MLFIYSGVKYFLFDTLFISIDKSKVVFNRNGMINEKSKSEIYEIYMKTWILPGRHRGSITRLLVIVFEDGTKVISRIDNDYKTLFGLLFSY